MILSQTLDRAMDIIIFVWVSVNSTVSLVKLKTGPSVGLNATL